MCYCLLKSHTLKVLPTSGDLTPLSCVIEHGPVSFYFAPELQSLCLNMFTFYFLPAKFFSMSLRVLPQSFPL